MPRSRAERRGKMKINEALTWDDLAEIYKEKTGRSARIRPMDEVFAFCKKLPEIFFNEKEGTLHKKEQK